MFSELLGVKRDRPDVSQRNKFKVQLSGQANDSFLSLMEEDMARKEAEKEKKKGKTRKRAPLQKAKEAEFNENVCQNCGTDYDDDDDDDQDAWIGCDVENCNRWFHFYCVDGFTSIAIVTPVKIYAWTNLLFADIALSYFYLLLICCVCSVVTKVW